jgi:hypothetical protein
MFEELRNQEVDTGNKGGNGQHPIIQTSNTEGIDNPEDIFGRMMKMVSDAVANSVVRTAMRGSRGVARDLIAGIKAIVMGVIRGSGEVGEAGLTPIPGG